jgi:hypothetical protein
MAGLILAVRVFVIPFRKDVFGKEMFGKDMFGKDMDARRVGGYNDAVHRTAMAGA